MKLIKPCKKCYTSENRGRDHCKHCGFKLEIESFDFHLEQAEAERLKNLSYSELQKLQQDRDALENSAKRSSAKASMNSTELIIVELLEEILAELRKSNKGSPLNAMSKALLNASATNFVENFSGEE